MAKDADIKVVAQNRKAAHEYFLEERLEAGVVLQGSEIKSIRASQVSIKEAYVQIEQGEAYLLNAHIAIYDPASRENHDPLRPRKLLLHKKELGKLTVKTRQKGYTIVPVRIYIVKGRAKVEIALARGKKSYDKRAVIAKRDSQREIQRELKNKNFA